MTTKRDATNAEIDHFYGRYIDLFNQGQVAEMQDLFEFPWAMLSTQGLFLVNDREAGLALYKKVWGDLKEEAWAATKIEKLEWFAVGADGALLQVDFVRFSHGWLDNAERARLLRRAAARRCLAHQYHLS